MEHLSLHFITFSPSKAEGEAKKKKAFLLLSVLIRQDAGETALLHTGMPTAPTAELTPLSSRLPHSLSSYGFSTPRKWECFPEQHLGNFLPMRPLLLGAWSEAHLWALILAGVQAPFGVQGCR